MQGLKIPPLMTSIVLLLWAWQSEQWLLGLLAATWLEWANTTNRQWDFSTKDINRIVDITSLVIVALMIYQSSIGPLSQAIFAVLYWAPLLFIPLLSAQLLSDRRGIEHRSLFISQRKSKDIAARRKVNLLLPYLAACLMAASQDALAPGAYYPSLVLVLVWFLWWNRSPTCKVGIWIIAIGLAAGLGYTAQQLLHTAQSELEEAVVRWLASIFYDDADPFQTRTALGDLGRLSLSDHIRYRVESNEPLQEPLLLRTAVYNRYFDSNWFSRHREFSQANPVHRIDTWQWVDERDTGERVHKVHVSAYLESKENILPVPSGVWRIEDLPVASVARNALGTIVAGEGPGLVRYLASYEAGSLLDAAPEQEDLRVPKSEQAVLQALAADMGLAEMATEAAIQKVAEYFLQNFTYTLELPGVSEGQTALSYFLREHRRGHCEYFATATVLLLRQAGIPARYAVGYSVQEPGKRPDEYLVRHSHAHAWTLVWQQGRWRNLDTTPPIWFGLETKKQSWWQPVLDFASEVYYKFALYRLESGAGQSLPWLWGAVILLCLVLAYRLRPKRGHIRTALVFHAKKREQVNTPLGSIEAVLSQAGFPRKQWETYGDWLLRLQLHPSLKDVGMGLEEIRGLHYRYRYTGEGLQPWEYLHMERLAEDWHQRWDKVSIQKHVAEVPVIVE